MALKKKIREIADIAGSAWTYQKLKGIFNEVKATKMVQNRPPIKGAFDVISAGFEGYETTLNIVNVIMDLMPILVMVSDTITAITNPAKATEMVQKAVETIQAEITNFISQALDVGVGILLDTEIELDADEWSSLSGFPITIESIVQIPDPSAALSDYANGLINNLANAVPIKSVTTTVVDAWNQTVAGGINLMEQTTPVAKLLSQTNTITPEAYAAFQNNVDFIKTASGALLVDTDTVFAQVSSTIDEKLLANIQLNMTQKLSDFTNKYPAFATSQAMNTRQMEWFTFRIAFAQAAISVKDKFNPNNVSYILGLIEMLKQINPFLITRAISFNPDMSVNMNLLMRIWKDDCGKTDEQTVNILGKNYIQSQQDFLALFPTVITIDKSVFTGWTEIS